ncbi:MAG: GNAT family N-acetyltransferase [Paracoccus sp. (in: a-proteobacteria)]
MLRDAGYPIAMGALKIFADNHAAELKSMHVLFEARGRGAAPRLLDALIGAAHARRASKIYLETGAQDSFAAARTLYRRAGFVTCFPFGHYHEDPASVFMMLDLAPSDPGSIG